MAQNNQGFTKSVKTKERRSWQDLQAHRNRKGKR